LIMAAPCASGDVTIQVAGHLVSRPYVDMTLAVMRAFGAVIDEHQTGTFQTNGTGYRGIDYDVEPDASGAR
jgi:3-phosphoshikimate 1-carboxyvinyltransferase